MEEQKQNESIDTFLAKSIKSGSNCILIGESHDKCCALLSVVNFLLTQEELCRSHTITLFYETYSALGEDNLSPYTVHTINNLPEDEDVKALLKLLITKNISLHGLETSETNPFKQFNNEDYIINENSIDELSEILKTHHLEEAFLLQYEKNIRDFISFTDFKTGWQLAAGIYGATDQRIQIPNQRFCELINTQDPNIIRICIVGNAHIPRVKKIDNGLLIDEGMANRLSQLNNIRNLAVTTTTNNPQHSGEPYVIIEDGNTYSPIGPICFIDSEKISENLQNYMPKHSPKNPRFRFNTQKQDSLRLQEYDERSALIQQSTNKGRCCRCCKLF